MTGARICAALVLAASGCSPPPCDTCDGGTSDKTTDPALCNDLPRNLVVEEPKNTPEENFFHPVDQVMRPTIEPGLWRFDSLPAEEAQHIEVAFPEDLGVVVPEADVRVIVPRPVEDYDAVQIRTLDDQIVLELTLSTTHYDGFLITAAAREFDTCDDDPGELVREVGRHEVLFAWDETVAARGGERVEGTVQGAAVRGQVLDDTRGSAVFGRLP